MIIFPFRFLWLIARHIGATSFSEFIGAAVVIGLRLRNRGAFQHGMFGPSYEGDSTFAKNAERRITMVRLAPSTRSVI